MPSTLRPMKTPKKAVIAIVMIFIIGETVSSIPEKVESKPSTIDAMSFIEPERESMAPLTELNWSLKLPALSPIVLRP